ncbi:MAG: hypothetical protein ACP5EP_12160 [Acidobacteriaceae bacterium]
MSFLLFYAVVTDLIELFLFIVYDRLPSQAYPNSIVVRFGGWLDAPNDFSCVLFLLMGWVYFKFEGGRRFLLEAVLFVCLILTQSLTAYGFLILLIFVSGMAHVIQRPRSVVWIPALLILLITLVIELPISGLLASILSEKSGSISAHLISPVDLLGNWSKWVLLGYSSYEFYEDWWVSSLLSFGAVWFIVCVFMMSTLVVSVVAKFRKCTNRDDKAVLGGFLVLSVYCLFGSINLPFLMMFPVNFMFYLFCFLVYFERLESGMGAEILSSLP